MSEQVSERLAVVEQRMTSHEAVCGERYGEIKDSFGRVHGRLDGLFKTAMAILAGIVLALGSELWKSFAG